ncbi:MAG: hypothetical protein QNJ97_15425 [Myxococcota bacterium]|nr:hypothetical protein [Myxococcota bacterium]
MGHKRIDETMIYIHLAEAHTRVWPTPVKQAAMMVDDPDQRVIAMLGSRVEVTPEMEKNEENFGHYLGIDQRVIGLSH